MSELQVCHFCELFGFNSKLNPVARMTINIGSESYEPGYEFVPEERYGGFDISQFIDYKVAFYKSEGNAVDLHMFVPDGTSKRAIVNLSPERILHRYGQLKHIEDAYEFGKFRIASALQYLLYENDGARKDNELVHAKDVPASDVVMTSEDGNLITPIGDVTFSKLHLAVDSYILCMAYDYDEKFYDWFEGSEACLVVDDVEEFANRLHAALEKVLPSHFGMNGRVTYGRHLSPLGVLFSKSLGFRNQREYRFSWTPKGASKVVSPEALIRMDMEEVRPLIPPPLDICIGSLRDISRIVVRASS